MSPAFLADQIDRSRANLAVDTIDVFYIHNPETQLGYISREEFERRIHAAFAQLEELVSQGKIRYYGIATWDGLRKGALDLARLAEMAGPHFRFIQLPFNFAMVEAFTGRPESVLETAARLGIVAIGSASLLQTRVLSQMPGSAATLFPGLDTDAQRAIQFARSTPGISVGLVGMSRREHVLDNLGVARVPPIPRDQYLRFYQ
jgi:aryl-alcohol dehydrogenase-like predicted oxidoreductase